MARSKAGIPVYTYFETEEPGYLPDALLEKVSRKLPTSDYIRLGSYLGVRMSDMAYLQCERNVTTLAREMLMVWYRKCSHTNWPELRQALSECHRNDLVAETKAFMELHMMLDDVQAPEQMWKVERYFSMLSEKIPRDWRDVAMYLGLTMSEIATICQPVPSDRTISNPVYEVLLAWKYNDTSPPDTLSRVLDSDMGRRDVAMFVDGLMVGVPTQIKVQGTAEPLVSWV